MAQVHRGRFGVMLFGALVARLLVSGPLSAQAPYAENQHGFPPNSTFAVNGLDNVNLFSGNLVETIPLGPNYPIGAGFSHQLHLVYNSKIWTGRVACYDSNANELSGTYVSGSPVVGAGWTIEVGHLKNIDLAEESPDNAEGAVFRYKGPDGSTHSFFGPDANGNYTTTDRSFLRAKGVLFGGGKLKRLRLGRPLPAQASESRGGLLPRQLHSSRRRLPAGFVDRALPPRHSSPVDHLQLQDGAHLGHRVVGDRRDRLPFRRGPNTEGDVRLHRGRRTCDWISAPRHRPDWQRLRLYKRTEIPSVRFRAASEVGEARSRSEPGSHLFLHLPASRFRHRSPVEGGRPGAAHRPHGRTSAIRMGLSGYRRPATLNPCQLRHG